MATENFPIVALVLPDGRKLKAVAVDDENFDKAEQIYAKLKAEIGDNDPELTSARVTLDLETM